MNMRFQSRYIVRTVIACGILGSLQATSCASDDEGYVDPPSTGPTGGATFGAGGRVVVAAGGVTGAGGFTGAGSTGAGGLGAGGLGAGGTSSDAGGDPDAATNPDASDGGPPCIVPDQPVIPDTSAFPACAIAELDRCTDGKCVPKNLVPADSQALLADCDANTKCVPDRFVQYNNQFIQPTCVSVAGAEGRCLSLCIPQVSEQAALLPKDICSDGELCTPCFDPRTGLDTSACHQGCDPGPTQPPTIFGRCCTDHGSCVPTSVVPEADRAQLGTDTCTGLGELCAPDKFSDLAYEPKECISLAGLEGRCIPDCVTAVAAQRDRLPTADCDPGERCAPCFDPLTGLDTGACRRGTDTPNNPTPTLFDECCGDAGKCVPTSALTPAQAGQLGRDTCSNTDLCAPDIFAISGTVAETCRALGDLNAEGRCVPTCVASVAAQADRLDQATCPSNHLCAPCFDPVTGADTLACSQNGDSPKEAKKTFPECCSGNGSCVPTSLVPDDQESQLSATGCTGTDVLCAPKTFAAPGFRPATCRSVANAEGRCISSCVPLVAEQADLLPRATCAAGELCAPCTDPRTGALTGACSLGGDAPVEAPVIFDEECCLDSGLCVPSEAVPASLRASVPRDTCATTGWVCAPKIKLESLSNKFQECHVWYLGIPSNPVETGGCIPKCIADAQIAGNIFSAFGLAPSNCPPDYRCAPCTNPLSTPPGASTGACD